MKLIFKIEVKHFDDNHNWHVLQYADNFEELYNTAWFWYSQTGKTCQIRHNMTLAHMADEYSNY